MFVDDPCFSLTTSKRDFFRQCLYSEDPLKKLSYEILDRSNGIAGFVQILMLSFLLHTGNKLDCHYCFGYEFVEMCAIKLFLLHISLSSHRKPCVLFQACNAFLVLSDAASQSLIHVHKYREDLINSLVERACLLIDMSHQAYKPCLHTIFQSCKICFQCHFISEGRDIRLCCRFLCHA